MCNTHYLLFKCDQKQKFIINNQFYIDQIIYYLLCSFSKECNNYKCEDPWFGKKKQTCKIQKVTKCSEDTPCIYKDKQIINTDDKTGNIQIVKQPIQTTNSYELQGSYVGAGVSGKYSQNKKYQRNSDIELKGNGEFVRVTHFEDIHCIQSRKNYLDSKSNQQAKIKNNDSADNQASNQANRQGDHQDNRQGNHQNNHQGNQQDNRQARDKPKQEEVGKVVVLAGIAVSGYVGGAYIWKKSIEEEEQHQGAQYAANVTIQSVGTAGGVFGGAMYGATIGSLGGPLGIFIGGGIGILSGSAVGYTLKKIMPWNW